MDENYIEFAEKGQENTLAGVVKDYENLFVIRSVTKFYGMAGIRLGYGIAASKLVKKLETCGFHGALTVLQAVRRLAAFNDTDFIENTKKQSQKNGQSLPKNLSEIEGLQVLPFGNKLSACKNKEPKNHIHQAQGTTCQRTNLNPRLLHFHGLRRQLLQSHRTVSQRQPKTNTSHRQNIIKLKPKSQLSI